jgi:hypothetical protein
VGRDDATSAADLPQTAMEIFLRRGLDDPNQVEAKGEFLLCRRFNHPGFALSLREPVSR